MFWKKLAISLLLLSAGVVIGLLVSPKNSEFVDVERASADAMCVEHGVPESACTQCHPELIPEFKGRGDWCAGHGVPESQCVLCNPELAQKFGEVNEGSHIGEDVSDGEMCFEHGVPESACTQCHPELIPEFKARGDWCAGHDVPESQCLLCNPELARVFELESEGIESSVEDAPLSSIRFPGISIIFEKNQPLCPTDGSVIQFASAETATRAGLEVRPLVVAPAAPRFEAPAEVVFDQTTTTMISSTLPITIRRWRVEPGTPVHAGEPLAEAESPDMAALQGEFLQAWSDWKVHVRERERSDALLARGLVDSAAYDRAVAEAVAAEGRQVQLASQLRLAGFGDDNLEKLRESRAVSSQFFLRAPTDGVLLDRPAPLGSLLETGVTLATVGDPNALWIEASVRDRDLVRIHQGQSVEFIPDVSGFGPVYGEVIWVSQFLDPHTRSGIVRAKPTSSPVSIRAHEFGNLQIPQEEETLAVLVPKDAVQWDGCCNVVFVKESPQRFQPRKVRLERGSGGNYRVLEGLSPHEEIVVGGSFLLKTELKKGSIGAGCCGLEAAT